MVVCSVNQLTGFPENSVSVSSQRDNKDDDEEQQQEATMMGAPSENNMPIVKVHNEEPSETVYAIEQTEEVVPMIIDPPAPKAALPHPAATGSSRTRRPCYGYISESESDSDYEEFLESRQRQVHVPTPGADLGKRKRTNR